MAVTTLVLSRPSLLKVFAVLSLLFNLISAQGAPPTYGGGAASTCPNAADGTLVSVNGGSVYAIYCTSDIGGTLTAVTRNTFDGCMVACDQNSLCGGAVWNQVDTCTLKRCVRAVDRTSNAGTYLAIRQVQPSCPTATSTVVSTRPVTVTTSYVQTSFVVSTARGTTVTSTAFNTIVSTFIQTTTQPSIIVSTATATTTQISSVIGTQTVSGPTETTTAVGTETLPGPTETIGTQTITGPTETLSVLTETTTAVGTETLSAQTETTTAIGTETVSGPTQTGTETISGPTETTTAVGTETVSGPTQTGTETVSGPTQTETVSGPTQTGTETVSGPTETTTAIGTETASGPTLTLSGPTQTTTDIREQTTTELSIVTSLLPGSTLERTTEIVTTIVQTTQLPGQTTTELYTTVRTDTITLPRDTVTLPGETAIQTTTALSTVLSVLPASTLERTTTIVQTTQLPGQTTTELYTTVRVDTITLPRETTTAVNTVTSLLPASSSIGIVNRAVCGAVNNYQSCLGSGFGSCCSQYNTCGSTDDFCGIGCQAGYGECNILPPSYSAAISSASSSLSSSASSASSSLSSAASSSAAQLSSSALVVMSTTTTSTRPIPTFPARVPQCAKICLAASDLQGCDPMDVSCICRNQDLIANYSCCLSQSCNSSFELMAIMAVGRALCACYGYFGLPTSAGCAPPIYSVTPSPIDQSPTTTATNFITPTASTCGNILESVTEQISSTTITSSTFTAPPSTPASTTAALTATPIPTGALPPCAKPCIATYERDSCFGGCSPLDVACICSNKVLVDSLSCCVAETCDGAGAQAVADFAHRLCGQYGVFTLPSSASCSNSTTIATSNGIAIISSMTVPGCTTTSALVTATPTPTGLPPCAQPCIAKYAAADCYGGCSPLDVTCICKNKPLLDELSCCVSRNCEREGVDQVVYFAHELCERYGVLDLPYSAGCASTLAIGPSGTGGVRSEIGSCATTTSGLALPSCLPCPKVCVKVTTVLAVTAY